MKKLFKVFLLCLLVFSLTFLIVGCGEKDEAYSINGIVTIDGTPTEGVTVKCKETNAEVVTNEKGEFSIEGLSGFSQVSVSKDNCDFLDDCKLVSKEQNKVEFFGYEKFSVEGLVTFNGECISNAVIIATSDTVERKTSTDEAGNFSLQALSGKVSISATHSEYGFLNKEITILNKEEKVVFDGNYEVKGKVVFEDKPLANVQITDGTNETLTDSNGEYILKNVGANKEIIAKLDGYCIKSLSGSAICDVENKEINFTAFETYDTAISLKNLGEDFKDNITKVVATGANECNKELYKEIYLKDTNILTNLFGDVKISVIRNNFIIASESLKAKTTSCNLNILNTIKGIVRDNIGAPVANVKVLLNGVDTNVTTDSNGEFVLNAITQLSNLELALDGFNIEQEGKSVNLFEITYIFKAEKIFNITGIVKDNGVPLSNVNVKYGLDKSVITDTDGLFTIPNQTGKVELIFTKTGYANKTLSVTEANKDIDITLNKEYDINCLVKSGDLVLSDASIYLNNEYKGKTDLSGKFKLEKLSYENEIKVVKEGYETVIRKVTNIDKDVTFDLGYKVTVITRSGDSNVHNTNIYYTDNNNKEEINVISERGEKTLLLYGTSSIRVGKENYEFTLVDGTLNKVDINAPQEKAIDFDSTYVLKIDVWKENAGGERISGVDILIKDGRNNILHQLNTPIDGSLTTPKLKGDVYILASKTLAANEKVTYLPRPLSFTNDVPTNLSFFDNAYSIKGKVTTGGIPVEGVEIIAENGKNPVKVVTNALGEYEFPVLKGNYELVLNKEGYKFKYNNIPIENEKPTITMADNGTNINFEATYDAVVIVKSGKKILSGASVFVNGILQEKQTDTQGRLQLRGISGKNIIKVTLDGFEFVDTELTCAGELEIQGTYRVTGNIFTGDISLNNVKVLVDNEEKTLTDENGYFEVVGLQGNARLTFELAGYIFIQNNILVDSLQEGIKIDSTYKVTGTIKTGNIAVSGVSIISGDIKAATNALGEFEIAGLSGKTQISFNKNGYDFGINTTKEVTGYTNIELDSKYDITGTIKSGDIILGQTKVFVNGQEYLTDDTGKFTINSLSGKNQLTFEKEGYEIRPRDVQGYEVLSIDNASYLVKGNVTNGSTKLRGVTVKIGDRETMTDNDGYFEISGVVGKNKVELLKADYKFDPASVNGYSSEEISINSTYKVRKQILYNNMPVKGVKVTYSGDETTGSFVTTDEDGWFEISNIKGGITVSLSLDTYHFDCGAGSTSFVIYNPDDITTKNITVTWDCFYVSGTVKFDSMTLPNVKVTLNGKTIITDENGTFIFDEICKTAQTVSASFGGVTVSGSTNKDADGVIALAFENNKDTQIAVLQNAYEFLKVANFRMNLNGNVKATAKIGPISIDAPQKSKKLVEQDSNGTMHYVYANWGDIVNKKTPTETVQVNPQCGQENYVESNNGVILTNIERNTGFGYRNGESYVDTSANITRWKSENFEDVKGAFKKDYGTEINEHSRYIINSSTITNISYSSGTFNVTFNESATTQLKVQMNKYSGQKILGFTKINASYTMDNKGRLSAVLVNEIYKVHQVVDVYPESAMTEQYTYGVVNTITLP